MCVRRASDTSDVRQMCLRQLSVTDAAEHGSASRPGHHPPQWLTYYTAPASAGRQSAVSSVVDHSAANHNTHQLQPV